MASVVTIDSGSVCWLVQVDSSQRVYLRWLGCRPRHHGAAFLSLRPRHQRRADRRHDACAPFRQAIGQRIGARGDRLAALNQ
jgi:hypothetical protein